MPTYDDFVNAAGSFRSASGSLNAKAGPLPGLLHQGVISGGTLSISSNDAMLQAASMLYTAAVECDNLADECDVRAQECLDAEAAQAAYESDYKSFEKKKSKWNQRKSDAQSAGEPFSENKPKPPKQPPTPPAYVELR